LNHAGVEAPFRGRSANITKKARKDVARLMRLDDGIDPATRGAITNVGLLFVTCLYFGAQFFEFPRRRFFVSAFFRAGENRKNSIAGLSRPHHGVACIWPGQDKTRIASLAAERVISGAKRATDHNRNFRHNGITNRIHQLRATADDSTLLRSFSYHKSSHILEEKDRQSSLITIHHETRGFVRAVRINDAAHLDSFRLSAHLQALAGDNT